MASLHFAKYLYIKFKFTKEKGHDFGGKKWTTQGILKSQFHSEKKLKTFNNSKKRS